MFSNHSKIEFTIEFTRYKQIVLGFRGNNLLGRFKWLFIDKLNVTFGLQMINWFLQWLSYHVVARHLFVNKIFAISWCRRFSRTRFIDNKAVIRDAMRATMPSGDSITKILVFNIWYFAEKNLAKNLKINSFSSQIHLAQN